MHNPQNLGELKGPLLLFGGPYSNFSALSALQTYASQHKIPASNIICTGDIVAYCGQPCETVAAIRQWGIPVVMGNCEESFAMDNSDCGCGFEQGSTCDLLSAQWFAFANERLGKTEREWFKQLPTQLNFRFNGIDCTVIHGGIRAINRFMFASHPQSRFLSELEGTDAGLIIGGHCGIPFSRKINRQLWHNPGVIGMPANDGTTRTWFSLLSARQNTPGGISVEIKALDYNYKQAMAAMDTTLVGAHYRQALATGLWPSVDVLPQAQQQAQGTPLAFNVEHYTLPV